MARFSDRVAVVTGGASGIGAATVRAFAREGARVVVGDLQEERGRELCNEIGAAARFVRCDVRSEADVARLVSAASDDLGRIDCMFNNAGFGGVLGPVDETPLSEFDLTFQVLVHGVFLGTKHAARAMKPAGRGCIVNTGSVAGLVGGYSPHAYAAAKAAVIHFTRSVALELAESGVRANCICPGFIATPLATNTVGQPDSAMDTARPGMARAQPVARPGEPEDIAETALWLASDAAGFVTGQHFAVDGGLTAGQRWIDQPEFFRSYRPIRVYRPDHT